MNDATLKGFQMMAGVFAVHNLTTCEIKKQKLSEWKMEAARRCAEAVTKSESDRAYAEFQRAKAAYEEHCREFSLVEYTTCDAD
jgi:hypothetical protein